MSTSLRQALLAGGIWVLAGKLVTVGTNLGVQALLSRLLPPAIYGDYFLAYSLVAVAGLVALLGLQHAVVRVVAEAMASGHPGKARSAVHRVFAWAVLGIAGIGVLLAVGPGSWLALRIWDSPLLGASMLGVACWTAAQALQILTSEAFRGFKRLDLAATFGGVVAGVLTVVTLAVVWVGGRELSLGGVIAISTMGLAIGVAIGLVVLGARILRRLGPAEPVRSAELFTIALPMWMSGLGAYVMFHSALWILAADRSGDEVAVYGAAARLVAVVSMPLLLVNLVVPPFVAEMFARGDRRRLERILRTAATIAGVPAFVVLVAFLLLGAPILGLIFGEYYRAGTAPLAWISLGAMANVWTGSCGVTLAMTGHQRWLMVITLASTAFTIVTGLILVRPHGAVGVAWAVCAGTIVQNVGTWIVAKRVTGVWTHVGMPSRDDVRAVLGFSNPG